MSWRPGYPVKLCLFAAAYFLAGKLGLLLAFEHGSVSPVWPPTGMALAGLLLLGYRYWPAVTLGAFVVNALTPVPSPLTTACGIAFGNTLEAVLGAWLLRRTGDFHLGLDRLKDVLRLLTLAALLSTLASATIGVLSLGLGNPALHGRSWRLGWEWWLGDAMGDLVVAPFVLTWASPRARPGERRRLLQAAALVASTLFVSLAIFGSWTWPGALSFPHWLFPLLIWAALSFGPRGATATTVLVSAVAILCTLRGGGPFAHPSVAESLMRLQAFLGVTAVTGLVLAAVTWERKDAEERLRALNLELEERVRVRTLDLAQANRELAQRIEENETFVYSVSHDLRSPLVNLQGFSQELALAADDLRAELQDPALPAPFRARIHTILDEGMAESIGFIRAGVLRLNGIIDALLRLSRVRRVEYNFRQVEVKPLIDRIVAAMNDTISRKGAMVTTTGLPSAWGDAVALEQVFANLIGNAVNYLDPGRPGRIEVGERVTTDPAADRSFVTYQVRDNGLGIPEAHRAKLFRAFQRLHPGVADGEGIGLTIVRRIVERHGGTIQVESTAGGGSTFFFSLPAIPAGAGPSPAPD